MSQSKQMARLTKELAHATQLRKSSIDAMRESTKALLAACADMRGDIARDYRVQMQRFLTSLSKDVAAHRRAMAHQIAQTQKFLGGKAKDVAAHRHATMNKIAHFGSARSKAAARLRSGLESQFGALVAQTGETISQLSGAHRKMAKQQKATLKSARNKLHKDMSSYVRAAHADRMKAQNIWSNFKLGKAA